MLRRATASLLLIIYFLGNVALGHAAETNFWRARRESMARQLEIPPLRPALTTALENPSVKDWPAVIQPLMRAFPLANASVKDVYADDGRTAPVMILQDVHLHAEAQANAAAVLNALIADGAVAHVGVEGAFHNLDFTKLRAFRDQPALKRVAKRFLDDKKLAAPTYAGIAADRLNATFIGVDDVAHYKANVDAYLNARTQKAAVDAELAAAQKTVAEEKERAYSPELKRFDELRGAHWSGKISLGQYAEKVSVIARSASQRRGNLIDFLEAYRLEKSLNFPTVERERRAAIEVLSQRLTKADTEELLTQTAAYRTGRLGFGAYYKALSQLCRAHGVNVESYPAFQKYLRYVALADGLNGDKILSELNALEQEISDKLAKKADEKRLEKETVQLRLTEKLVNFELTAEEWEKYRNEVLSNQFSVLSKNLRTNKLRTENFILFYKEADIRSTKMVDNLLRGTRNEGRGTVLVVGGFHAAEITKLLRDKKIPYVTVTPNVTKVEKASGYETLSVFAREKAALDKIFEAEKLTINLATVNLNPALEEALLEQAGNEAMAARPVAEDEITDTYTETERNTNVDDYVSSWLDQNNRTNASVLEFGIGIPPQTPIELAKKLEGKAHVIGVDINVTDFSVSFNFEGQEYMVLMNRDPQTQEPTIVLVLAKVHTTYMAMLQGGRTEKYPLDLVREKALADATRLLKKENEEDITENGVQLVHHPLQKMAAGQTNLSIIRDGFRLETIPNGSQDVIRAMNVFMHYTWSESISAAIDHMGTKLKDGGLLLIGRNDSVLVMEKTEKGLVIKSLLVGIEKFQNAIPNSVAQTLTSEGDISDYFHNWLFESFNSVRVVAYAIAETLRTKLAGHKSWDTIKELAESSGKTLNDWFVHTISEALPKHHVALTAAGNYAEVGVFERQLPETIGHPTSGFTKARRNKHVDDFISSWLISEKLNRKASVVEVGTGFPAVTTKELAERLRSRAHITGVDLNAADFMVGFPLGDVDYCVMMNHNNAGADPTIVSFWVKKTGSMDFISPTDNSGIYPLDDIQNKATDVAKRLLAKCDGRDLAEKDERIVFQPLQKSVPALPNLTIVRGGFELGPVPDGSADILRVLNVFLYYLNPHEATNAVKHMGKKLRVGGILLIGDDDTLIVFRREKDRMVFQSVLYQPRVWKQHVIEERLQDFTSVITYNNAGLLTPVLILPFPMVQEIFSKLAKITLGALIPLLNRSGRTWDGLVQYLTPQGLTFDKWLLRETKLGAIDHDVEYVGGGYIQVDAEAGSSNLHERLLELLFHMVPVVNDEERLPNTIFMDHLPTIQFPKSWTDGRNLFGQLTEGKTLLARKSAYDNITLGSKGHRYCTGAAIEAVDALNQEWIGQSHLFPENGGPSSMDQMVEIARRLKKEGFKSVSFVLYPLDEFEGFDSPEKSAQGVEAFALKTLRETVPGIEVHVSIPYVRKTKPEYETLELATTKEGTFPRIYNDRAISPRTYTNLEPQLWKSPAAPQPDPQPEPVGHVTSFITSRGRHAVSDEFIAATIDEKHLGGNAVVVDFGIGFPPYTTMELADRLEGKARVIGADLNVTDYMAIVDHNGSSYRAFFNFGKNGAEDELVALLNGTLEQHLLPIDNDVFKDTVADVKKKASELKARSGGNNIEENIQALVYNPQQDFIRNNPNLTLIRAGFELGSIENESVDILRALNVFFYYATPEQTEKYLELFAPKIKTGGLVIVGGENRLVLLEKMTSGKLEIKSMLLNPAEFAREDLQDITTIIGAPGSGAVYSERLHKNFPRMVPLFDAFVQATYLTLAPFANANGNWDTVRARARESQVTLRTFLIRETIPHLQENGYTAATSIDGNFLEIAAPQTEPARLTLPFWSLFFSKEFVSSDEFSEKWAPKLELFGLPGFALMLWPFMELHWAILVGSALFALFHGLPVHFGRAPPAWYAQTPLQFLVRFGVTLFIIAWALLPLLILNQLSTSNDTIKTILIVAEIALAFVRAEETHGDWNTFVNKLGKREYRLTAESQDQKQPAVFDSFEHLARWIHSHPETGIDLRSYPVKYGKFAVYRLLEDLALKRYQLRPSATRGKTKKIRTVLDVGVRLSDTLNRVIGTGNILYEPVQLSYEVFQFAYAEIKKHPGLYKETEGFMLFAKKIFDKFEGKGTHLGKLYDLFGSEKGEAALGQNQTWPYFNFPYRRLIKAAAEILARIESGDANEAPWGAIGMMRIAKWLHDEDETTNLGHLSVAFGATGKFQRVVDILLGKSVDTASLHWPMMAFPYERLIETAREIKRRIDSGNPDEDPRGVVGMMRIAQWLNEEKGVKTHLSHLYAAFGGKGKLKPVMRELLGEDISIDDLGWQRIDMPYDRAIKTAMELKSMLASQNPERNPRATAGMLRLAKTLHPNGKLHLGHLYSLFGGPAKLQPVMKILIDEDVTETDLKWAPLDIPFELAVAMAQEIDRRIALNDHDQDPRGVAGMLRMAQWWAAKTKAAKLPQLYLLCREKENLGILLGKEIDVDMQWKRIDVRFDLLVEIAQEILRRLKLGDKNASPVGITGMLRIAQWLKEEKKETHHVGALFSAFGGEEKASAVIQVLTGQNSPVTDLEWRLVAFPYDRLLLTAAEIIHRFETKDPTQNPQGIAGMIGIARWLKAEGHPSFLGGLMSAFGGRDKMRLIASVLFDKEINVVDMGWQEINMSYDTFMDNVIAVLAKRPPFSTKQKAAIRAVALEGNATVEQIDLFEEVWPELRIMILPRPATLDVDLILSGFDSVDRQRTAIDQLENVVQTPGIAETLRGEHAVRIAELTLTGNVQHDVKSRLRTILIQFLQSDLLRPEFKIEAFNSFLKYQEQLYKTNPLLPQLPPGNEIILARYDESIKQTFEDLAVGFADAINSDLKMPARVLVQALASRYKIRATGNKKTAIQDRQINLAAAEFESVLGKTGTYSLAPVPKSKTYKLTKRNMALVLPFWSRVFGDDVASSDEFAIERAPWLELPMIPGVPLIGIALFGFSWGLAIGLAVVVALHGKQTVTQAAMRLLGATLITGISLLPLTSFWFFPPYTSDWILIVHVISVAIDMVMMAGTAHSVWNEFVRKEWRLMLGRPTPIITEIGRNAAMDQFIETFIDTENLGPNASVVEVGLGFPPYTPVELAKKLEGKAHVTGVDIQLGDYGVRVEMNEHNYWIAFNDHGNRMTDPVVASFKDMVSSNDYEQFMKGRYNRHEYDDVIAQARMQARDVAPHRSYIAGQKNLSFEKAGFELTGIPDNSANIIRVANVMCYYSLEQMEEALTHFAKKLKTNGIVMIGADSTFALFQKREDGSLPLVSLLFTPDLRELRTVHFLSAVRKLNYFSIDTFSFNIPQNVPALADLFQKLRRHLLNVLTPFNSWQNIVDAAKNAGNDSAPQWLNYSLQSELAKENIPSRISDDGNYLQIDVPDRFPPKNTLVLPFWAWMLTNRTLARWVMGKDTDKLSDAALKRRALIFTMQDGFAIKWAPLLELPMIPGLALILMPLLGIWWGFAASVLIVVLLHKMKAPIGRTIGTLFVMAPAVSPFALFLAFSKYLPNDVFWFYAFITVTAAFPIAVVLHRWWNKKAPRGWRLNLNDHPEDLRLAIYLDAIHQGDGNDLDYALAQLAALVRDSGIVDKITSIHIRDIASQLTSLRPEVRQMARIAMIEVGLNSELAGKIDQTVMSRLVDAMESVPDVFITQSLLAVIVSSDDAEIRNVALKALRDENKRNAGRLKVWLTQISKSRISRIAAEAHDMMDELASNTASTDETEFQEKMAWLGVIPPSPDLTPRQRTVGIRDALRRINTLLKAGNVSHLIDEDDIDIILTRMQDKQAPIRASAAAILETVLTDSEMRNTIDAHHAAVAIDGLKEPALDTRRYALRTLQLMITNRANIFGTIHVLQLLRLIVESEDIPTSQRSKRGIRKNVLEILEKIIESDKNFKKLRKEERNEFQAINRSVDKFLQRQDTTPAWRFDLTKAFIAVAYGMIRWGNSRRLITGAVVTRTIRETVQVAGQGYPAIIPICDALLKTLHEQLGSDQKQIGTITYTNSSDQIEGLITSYLDFYQQAVVGYELSDKEERHATNIIETAFLQVGDTLVPRIDSEFPELLMRTVTEWRKNVRKGLTHERAFNGTVRELIDQANVDLAEASPEISKRLFINEKSKLVFDTPPHEFEPSVLPHGTLSLPLWSWVFGKKIAQSETFVREVAPLLELWGLPGFALAFMHVTDPWTAVVLGGVLFALLHDIIAITRWIVAYVAGRSPPEPGWNLLKRVGARMFGSIVISALASLPIQYAETVTIFSYLLSAKIAYGLHNVWNTWIPKAWRLALDNPRSRLQYLLQTLGRPGEKPAVMKQAYLDLIDVLADEHTLAFFGINEMIEVLALTRDTDPIIRSYGWGVLELLSVEKPELLDGTVFAYMFETLLTINAYLKIDDQRTMIAETQENARLLFAKPEFLKMHISDQTLNQLAARMKKYSDQKRSVDPSGALDASLFLFCRISRLLFDDPNTRHLVQGNHLASIIHMASMRDLGIQPETQEQFWNFQVDIDETFQDIAIRTYADDFHEQLEIGASMITQLVDRFNTVVQYLPDEKIPVAQQISRLIRNITAHEDADRGASIAAIWDRIYVHIMNAYTVSNELPNFREDTELLEMVATFNASLSRMAPHVAYELRVNRKGQLEFGSDRDGQEPSWLNGPENNDPEEGGGPALWSLAFMIPTGHSWDIPKLLVGIVGVLVYSLVRYHRKSKRALQKRLANAVDNLPSRLNVEDIDGRYREIALGQKSPVVYQFVNDIEELKKFVPRALKHKSLRMAFIVNEDDRTAAESIVAATRIKIIGENEAATLEMVQQKGLDDGFIDQRDIDQGEFNVLFPKSMGEEEIAAFLGNREWDKNRYGFFVFFRGLLTLKFEQRDVQKELRLKMLIAEAIKRFA